MSSREGAEPKAHSMYNVPSAENSTNFLRFGRSPTELLVDSARFTDSKSSKRCLRFSESNGPAGLDSGRPDSNHQVLLSPRPRMAEKLWGIITRRQTQDAGLLIDYSPKGAWLWRRE